VIKDPEGMPHLVGALSEPVLDALDRVLAEQVGRDTADAVLAAFNEEIADLPRQAEVQAELDEGVAAVKRLKETALAKLAGTAGVQWGPWRRGHYVVTLDGQHIGDVNPQTTMGHSPPRYKNFVGRAHGTFANTAVFKYASEAAQQVGADYMKAKGLAPTGD